MVPRLLRGRRGRVERHRGRRDESTPPPEEVHGVAHPSRRLRAEQEGRQGKDQVRGGGGRAGFCYCSTVVMRAMNYCCCRLLVRAALMLFRGMVL